MRKIVLLVCVLLALPALGQTTLNGAGATFPNPIYSKWFSEYHKLHSDVQVNYQPIGSGGGIRQLIAGTVDFGASDMPMTDKQLQEAKTKILNIPTVAGRGRSGLQHPRRKWGSEVHARKPWQIFFWARSLNGMIRRSLQSTPG